MNRSDLALVELATSVYAESDEHEFTNIHPGFLASKGIVPSDWIRDDFRINSSFSEIEYENGVQLFSDEDMLRVSQRQDVEVGAESEPSGLVVRYIASVAPDVFSMARLEWRFLAPIENSSEWITNRFFRPEIFFENWDRVRAFPFLSFDTGNLLVSLSFHATQIGEGNDDDESSQTMVGIACRASHPQFADDAKLSGWLLERLKHEEVILSILLPLLEIEDDNV